MKKIAYIIPGYYYSPQRAEYLKVANFFEAKGIIAIAVPIKWQRTTINDWVSQFMEIYKKTHESGDKVYILGFSFGAMIALIVGGQIKIHTLILCSLSPYFKEDLPHLKESWKSPLGSNRIKAFEQLSFNTLAKQINVKTYLLAGDKEGKESEKIFLKAQKKIARNTPLYIKGVKHDLGQKEYLESVRKVIQEF